MRGMYNDDGKSTDTFDDSISGFIFMIRPSLSVSFLSSLLDRLVTPANGFILTHLEATPPRMTGDGRPAQWSEELAPYRRADVHDDRYDD